LRLGALRDADDRIGLHDCLRRDCGWYFCHRPGCRHDASQSVGACSSRIDKHCRCCGGRSTLGGVPGVGADASAWLADRARTSGTSCNERPMRSRRQQIPRPGVGTIGRGRQSVGLLSDTGGACVAVCHMAIQAEDVKAARRAPAGFSLDARSMPTQALLAGGAPAPPWPEPAETLSRPQQAHFAAHPSAGLPAGPPIPGAVPEAG
jgi:hypothetical protein